MKDKPFSPLQASLLSGTFLTGVGWGFIPFREADLWDMERAREGVMSRIAEAFGISNGEGAA